MLRPCWVVVAVVVTTVSGTRAQQQDGPSVAVQSEGAPVGCCCCCWGVVSTTTTAMKKKKKTPCTTRLPPVNYRRRCSRQVGIQDVIASSLLSVLSVVCEKDSRGFWSWRVEMETTKRATWCCCGREYPTSWPEICGRTIEFGDVVVNPPLGQKVIATLCIPILSRQSWLLQDRCVSLSIGWMVDRFAFQHNGSSMPLQKSWGVVCASCAQIT